ncbi:MAG: preprotein translocase subunit SecE [Dehalococcoidia bacterium]|nr:preprotein translocase subunit SecE [Dehalococcoidia bacterium]
MTIRPIKSAARPGRPNIGARPSLKWVREIVSELKKVTWPSREEATNLTTLVLVVSIAVGVFLGSVDYIFSQLINVLLLR